MRRAGAWIAAALALAASAPAWAAPRPDGLVLERVVLVMRHGIRPPTKEPALPAGVTRGAWPRWPVQPGWLTPHGALAIRLLAGYDRAEWRRAGLIPAAGCPADVAIWADVDERTIATGQAFADGLAPGCGLPVGHAAGTVDPVFDPIASGDAPLDSAQARQAVVAQAGAGGLEGAVARHRPQLARIQTVLGCCEASICQQFAVEAPCGLPDLPTTLADAGREEPKLKGALGWGATMSEVLLLEYSEGLPMAQVGFGRIDRAGMMDALALHPLEFDLLHRPPVIARAGASELLHRIAGALRTDSKGAALQIFVGHDTTLAYLGGALGLHWAPADYPRDDPPPGGGLGFERLRDRRGHRYVRIFFQVQSPEQMRDLVTLDAGHPPMRDYLAIPGCGAAGDPCPIDRFEKLLAGA